MIMKLNLGSENFMSLLAPIKMVELNDNDCDLEVTSIARYALNRIFLRTTSYYTNKPGKLKIIQC